MVTRWKDHYAGAKRGSIANVVFERLSCNDKGLVNLQAAGSSPLLSITPRILDASADSDTELLVARFTVSSSPIVVGLLIRGTATPGIPYTALPRTITIPANQRSASLRVHPLTASVAGPPATVLVELDHSPARSYMPGPDHRVRIALVHERAK